MSVYVINKRCELHTSQDTTPARTFSLRYTRDWRHSDHDKDLILNQEIYSLPFSLRRILYTISTVFSLILLLFIER